MFASRLVMIMLSIWPLLLLTLAISWINDRTGITSFMVDSWQSLSGVNTPGAIVQNCSNTGVGTSLFVLLLALVSAVFGMCAIFGIPIGIVGTFGGGISGLFSKDDERYLPLMYGLAILTVGLGGLLLAGLDMRWMHSLSGSGCG
ncbi:MAG: hypothetical protein JWN38_818 [Candidatus Saccharibacteria bacterium]|nr:hypothetical protein [Candidatus Saccharibacteria bacterium]